MKANVVNTLDSATGLSWSEPPAQPSFLANGYHTKIRMVVAPHFVRRLQQAAIEATGRPRTIIFEACGRGNAMINIPKEIAESDAFLHMLAVRPQRIVSKEPAIPFAAQPGAGKAALMTH